MNVTSAPCDVDVSISVSVKCSNEGGDLAVGYQHLTGGGVDQGCVSGLVGFGRLDVPRQLGGRAVAADPHLGLELELLDARAVARIGQHGAERLLVAPALLPGAVVDRHQRDVAGHVVAVRLDDARHGDEHGVAGRRLGGESGWPTCSNA